MTKPPKPDLSEYEEERVPLDDVLKRLVEAKPASSEKSQSKKEKRDE
jgi:hypothetical protein